MELNVHFSTIADGNMSARWGPEDQVTENRQKFLAKHGLKIEDTVALLLADDDTIAIVDRRSAGTTVRAEAALTQEAGLPLFLYVADCTPVVFFDVVHSVLAVAHLSWRTADVGLAGKVVLRMVQEFGTDPSQVSVVMGPSARKESYIQPDVLQKSDPAWVPFLSKVEGGISIDVVGFVTADLVSVGVTPEHIAVDSTDTIPSTNYFSHYRAVRTGEAEGRFATVAVMR